MDFSSRPARKTTSPRGQLPYMEVDGKPLAESMAMARYAARIGGLTGKDDFEAAQAGKRPCWFSIDPEVRKKIFQLFSHSNFLLRFIYLF